MLGAVDGIVSGEAEIVGGGPDPEAGIVLRVRTYPSKHVFLSGSVDIAGCVIEARQSDVLARQGLREIADSARAFQFDRK